MQWADEVRIETPEQIDVSLEVAGLGSRFVAQMYDWGVKWGILLLVVLLMALFAILLNLQRPDRTALILLGTLAVVLFYSFLLGFDIYFEVRHNGQTPGKRQAGIRVVKEGGAPVDFTAASVRNLLGLADFLPSFYLLGSLILLLNPRGQRLGDMAAGTLVIRERAHGLPVDHLDAARELASDAFHFTAPQVATCTEADRTILKNYFQRRHEMDPPARDALALRLLGHYVQKTRFPLDPSFDDAPRAESFLASLYRDLNTGRQTMRDS